MSKVDKERKLTSAEIKRLNIYNEIIKKLEANNYLKNDLTTTPLKANTLGVLYGILLATPFVILYFITADKSSYGVSDSFFANYIIWFIALLFLIVVHELLHGLTWSIFTKEKLKSISFGIIWKSLNPYCTCNEALKRNEYILGLLMPCIVLGIIPAIISLFNHNNWWLVTGAVMIMSAGGDLLILKMILDHKGSNDDLYLDHPTEIGLTVFEKRKD